MASTAIPTVSIIPAMPGKVRVASKIVSTPIKRKRLTTKARSAIILFFLGSGPVKGFALTLGIGVLTTLFCAYFFARHLSSFYVMRNKDKQILI